MFKNFLIVIGLLIIFQSCSKNELVYENKEVINPFNLYKEGIEAFNKNDYFFASKKFSEAEINFQNMDFAAKSALVTGVLSSFISTLPFCSS